VLCVKVSFSRGPSSVGLQRHEALLRVLEKESGSLPDYAKQSYRDLHAQDRAGHEGVVVFSGLDKEDGTMKKRAPELFHH